MKRSSIQRTTKSLLNIRDRIRFDLLGSQYEINELKSTSWYKSKLNKSGRDQLKSYIHAKF
ncbi:hypothetical protein [Paenibacillus sp. AN1007]|uniref:Uncharacterized protein n=1 Tax=Paenibacillus sp. AN1007 TaxID=3151385 RepID=A0AAU8NH47_9BACL